MVWFSRGIGGAGSGGHGGEWPCRARLGEPFIWGASPAVRGPGSPRCWTLGAAAVRGPERILRWGGTVGTRLAVLPKRRGNFPACPAPQRREPGRGRVGPFHSSPAALRGWIYPRLSHPHPSPPVCFHFPRRANYYNSRVIHMSPFCPRPAWQRPLEALAALSPAAPCLHLPPVLAGLLRVAGSGDQPRAQLPPRRCLHVQPRSGPAPLRG